MAHRLGIARSFAQTKPGKIFLGAVALLLLVWMAKWMAKPDVLPCAKSDEEFDLLPVDEKEVTLLVPSSCWTQWQLRPTDAPAFFITAPAVMKIEKAFADPNGALLLAKMHYDPREWKPDMERIMGARFWNETPEPVPVTIRLK